MLELDAKEEWEGHRATVMADSHHPPGAFSLKHPHQHQSFPISVPVLPHIPRFPFRGLVDVMPLPLLFSLASTTPRSVILTMAAGACQQSPALFSLYPDPLPSWELE